jgi:hypothetical protein
MLLQYQRILNFRKIQLIQKNLQNLKSRLIQNYQSYPRIQLILTILKIHLIRMNLKFRLIRMNLKFLMSPRIQNFQKIRMFLHYLQFLKFQQNLKFLMIRCFHSLLTFQKYLLQSAS